MTHNCNPGNCLSDLERRPNKTLAGLIDALALAAGLLGVFYYKPDGMVAGIIVFVGAYTFTHSLQYLNWASLWSISAILLGGLGFAVHLCTLLTAPASFTGLVFTFLLPGIAEAYWIWAKWATMGTLSHPVTLMCVAWLGLFGTAMLARCMVGNGRPNDRTEIRQSSETRAAKARERDWSSAVGGFSARTTTLLRRLASRR